MSYVHTLFLSIACTTMTSKLNGQAQVQPELGTPNKFQGFTLGISLSDFLPKNIKVLKKCFQVPFSDIKTSGMAVYSLSDQLTESNDKIDFEFFFYHDTLSVIRVRYKNKQSSKDLIEALKARYGDDNRFEDDVYNDPALGSSKVIENLYWGKSPCCTLNLTSDDIGLVYLTFADKTVQVKLRAQELINNQKKIN